MDEKQRTIQQNKALHKFCQLLADELNAKGHGMKFVLESLGREQDIPWTMPAVKEHLWKPVQKAIAGKESTTELNTIDPTPIHQSLMHVLNQAIDGGVDYIDWPSLR
jgi:hypothetical protein